MTDILTPRQHDVMIQLMKGISNQEIAEALFMSESTVKTHLCQILDRLPPEVVRTRTGMAVWYLDWRYTVLRGCVAAAIENPENVIFLAEALRQTGADERGGSSEAQPYRTR